MIILLSPAKTLDESPKEYPFHSQPRHLADTSELVSRLRGMDSPSIQELMGLSVKLADLNLNRYQEFATPFTQENAQPAALMFKGDVYTSLQAQGFDEEEMRFAQKHLRILSGLYGVLRPMDLMQPYRLEMGTKLHNARGKNLYEFWGTAIAETLNADLRESGGDAIINLASNEYFKSVDKKALKGDLYHIHFQEERNGKFKVISFNAKKARGLMARWIVENRITQAADIRGFAEDGYILQESRSGERDWVFTR